MINDYLKRNKMKSSELYAKNLKEKLGLKSNIDVIHVNDAQSRFYGGRFTEDIGKLVGLYESLATFNYSTMTSSTFIDIYSKLELRRETVVILDNVKNPFLFDVICDLRVRSFNKEVDADKLDDQDAETNEKIRKLNFRTIYILDEFVWEGVAGRSKSIYDCKLIEDLMSVSDTIIVPNVELQSALVELGLVSDEHKGDVIIMPITVSSTVYPVNRKVTARTYSSKIDKPSVLIKGVQLTKNLCEFIVAKHKKYNITISTICQLPDDVMVLLNSGDVKHIIHYTSPAVNGKNIVHTFTDERDAMYDFVIYSSSDMLYDLAAVDSDALFSVASGSCVFACVKDAEFEKNTHICCATNTDFAKASTYNKIDDMLSKYSVAVNWNELYNRQRAYIEDKISDKPVALGRLFAVLIGKDVAEKRFSGKEDND